jgi:hypothetical protein
MKAHDSAFPIPQCGTRAGAASDGDPLGWFARGGIFVGFRSPPAKSDDLLDSHRVVGRMNYQTDRTLLRPAPV